jgi:molecular chaperone GrpE
LKKFQYKTIQQRMSAQNKQGDSMSTIKVVREMLDLLDNFDRAFGSVKPQTDAEIAIQAEYKTVYESMLETFKKLGVTEVETVGLEFDYAVHQAVMQRPSPDYDEGIVCEEYQKGFKLNDQLIRAAMVAVAA